MTEKQDQPRISLDLPDESAAMRIAQQIADACGGTVTVVDVDGENIGETRPHPSVTRHAAMTIASLQKLADAMDAWFKKPDGRHDPDDP
jgi:hypothetical protein